MQGKLLHKYVVQRRVERASCVEGECPVDRRNSTTTNLEKRIECVENGLNIRGKQNPDSEPINIYERMRHFRVPGVSIAVVNNGKIEWVRGYGVLDAETEVELDPHCVLHACSMSKFITAVAALKLVQEGKLALDEDVNQRLHSWKIPENELTFQREVTLRSLLSHQAGIIDPDDSFGVYQANDRFPSLLDILEGSTLYNPKSIQIETLPQSNFSYSDAGYCIVEQLLTDVTGRQFGELAQELVFEPLEMGSSRFEYACEFEDTTRFASGHDRTGALVAGKRATYPYLAASGLWSTPSDLALLIVELHHSLNGNGKLQISPHLIQDMISSQGCAEGVGLGVFLSGNGKQTRMVSLGWGVGFQCMLAAYPHLGAGFVVMTNSEPGCHQEEALVGELVRSIEREYSWTAT